MNTILNYIKNGRGVALKYILLFSFIISPIGALYIYDMTSTLIPFAQKASDEILPIKIENHVVVTPESTVKTIPLLPEGLGTNFSVYIDTTKDLIETEALDEGFYLTKKAFYAVTNNKISVYKLNDSLDLPQGDYTNVFKKICVYASYITFAIILIYSFLGLLILSLFYTGITYLFSGLLGVAPSFDMRMRLVNIVLLSVYAFVILLFLVGVNLSSLITFIINMGLILFGLKKTV